MSKIIKFPLKMADGAQVKTIEELRGHFDLADVIRYYHDGRLCKWLKAWYYDEEADRVEQLDSCSEDFKKDLCDILGVPYLEDRFSNVDINDISKKNERLERLKQFTADDRILESVENVAFTQEEMMVLLGKGERVIYLCGDCFSVPGDMGNITYVGVNNPKIEIDSGIVAAGIDFQEVEFNISLYIDGWVDDFIDHFIDYLRDDYLVDDNQNMNFYIFFENNLPLGVKLLRQEAEKGSAKAETILGLCCVSGLGVKESIEEAIMWFQKAAGQNYVRAQYMLGLAYLEGKYASNKSYKEIKKEAVKCLKIAANQGYVQAQYALGEVYYYGRLR